MSRGGFAVISRLRCCIRIKGAKGCRCGIVPNRRGPVALRANSPRRGSQGVSKASSGVKASVFRIDPRDHAVDILGQALERLGLKAICDGSSGVGALRSFRGFAVVFGKGCQGVSVRDRTQQTRASCVAGELAKARFSRSVEGIIQGESGGVSDPRDHAVDILGQALERLGLKAICDRLVGSRGFAVVFGSRGGCGKGVDIQSVDRRSYRYRGRYLAKPRWRSFSASGTMLGFLPRIRDIGLCIPPARCDFFSAGHRRGLRSSGRRCSGSAVPR